MNLIRSALHMLWMAVTIIPWCAVLMAAAPFVSRQRRYRICVAWLNVAVRGGAVILGIKNRVTGLENLPADARQQAVVLVKHQSAWETFVMPIVLLPRQLAFTFKRELLFIPFFGWAMGMVDMIHIDRRRRTAAYNKVQQQGQRLVGQGIWVIMFPEGTRVGRGEKGVYRIGGARLAVQCGAPVIPVAVTSARCWPPRAFIKRPGVVDISIGKPIATAGRDARAVISEVENWIEAEMLRLDPDAYPDGAARLSTREPGQE